MEVLTLQESQLNLLRAPMPGVVKSIACMVGDSVEEGSTIVVLEAMKMQNPLFAPMTGKVCSISALYSYCRKEYSYLLCESNKSLSFMPWPSQNLQRRIRKV